MILGKQFMLAPKSIDMRVLGWATNDRVLTASYISDEVATYKLWNTETRKCIGEKDYFIKEDVIIFKDENYFVTHSKSGHVKIWNLQSGKSVAIQRKFFFNNKQLVDDLVHIKRLIGFGENHCWMRTENKDIVIFNMKTLNEIVIPEEVSFCDSLCIAGNRLCQYLDENQVVKIWDTETGECIFRVSEQRGLYHPCLSGKLLLASSNHYLKIWDIDAKSCVRELNHGEYVRLHKVHGNRVMTVSDNSTKIWDLETGNCLHTLNQSWHCMDAKRKMIGKLLLAGDSSGKLNIWNMETGELWRSLQVSVKDDGFDRWFEMSGNLLFVGKESLAMAVQIYDVDSGRLLHHLNIGKQGRKEYSIHGNCLVVKSLDWMTPSFIEIFDFRDVGSSNN